jgi:Ca2+-binding RTX toxin-like protein
MARISPPSRSGAQEDSIRNIENVYGVHGADQLIGDDQSNLFRGGWDNDTLDGGAGSDTVDYSDKGDAVVVTLNGASDATVTVNGMAEDTIRNIEHLHGGSAADTLTGDGQINLLRGGDGADTLDGGVGFDTADYSDKTESVVATLAGSANATVTIGGFDEDMIRNFENIVAAGRAPTCCRAMR